MPIAEYKGIDLAIKIMSMARTALGGQLAAHQFWRCSAYLVFADRCCRSSLAQAK
jgi:hypothetical protein